ncbi:MAG TPA: class I SAM-dependent methyltransferase [Emcibacteraceae bacterium]|nr:class I SAM-dependent methyltransferase [Emcibacteraceae bacterium]
MTKIKNKDDWKEGNEENIKIFDDLLSRHGADFKALDWGSKESQLLRFKILSEIDCLNHASILDVGCGLGDLYEWFQNEKINTHYMGIDITPSLIEAAKNRYPNTMFSTINILNDDGELNEPYNYVFASGIFAKHQKAGEGYVHAMIQKMYALCDKGLAFNSLSSLSKGLDDDDFGLNPDELLTFCRSLTPWVVLRQDYHPNDMTIYMYREKRT